MDIGGNIVNENLDFTGPGTVTASNLEAGTYDISIIDNSSGCTRLLDNISLSNADPGFGVNAVPTSAGCDGSSGSITVTIDSSNVFPITYSLLGAESPSPIDTGSVGTGNSFVISGLSPDNYTLNITSNIGCVQSLPVSPVLPATAVDSLEIAGDLRVCADDPTTSLTASANGANRYEWTLPDGSMVTGAGLTADQSGTYTVVASDTSGNLCPTTQTIEVALTSEPEVEIMMLDDLCDGSVTLEARVNTPNNSPYIYNWSNGATSRTITVDASGSYSVNVRTADDLTCPGSNSLSIDFPETIEATISAAPACQDGQPVTISVEVIAANPVTYAWRRGNSPIAGETGSSILVANEGDYTVTITDDVSSCFEERSITVRRNALPTGLLPERARFCSDADTSITLIPGVGFSTYEWTLDGRPYPQADATFTPQEAGEYIVTMTTPFGCVRQDTVQVLESCEPAILAPNAFVPEGFNSTFYVVPNDPNYIGDFVIFIYNRWGELIFQSSSLDFEWDGTFKGEPVPVGAYPYTIRYTSSTEPNNGIREQVGSVTVIR